MSQPQKVKETYMKKIYTIHAPEAEKLEAVKAEMLSRGAPTIHVVDCGDYYMALEGCHRIAAAHDLGYEPQLIIHDQDDMIDISGYDWFEHGSWADTQYLAGEIAGEIFCARQARAYAFDQL